MRLFHSTNYPFCLILLLAVCICANTFADTSEDNSDADKVLPEPHRIVENITNRLLSIISDEKLDPIQNPDEFYDHANEILESVVAFDYIAKGVMGNYADQVTSAQLVQFVEVFKKGLVNIYSKGIAGLSDSLDITTLQPEVEIKGQRKVSVVQKISNQGTSTYISYTMAQNRNKQWKLINVVLNGVNLGKTFRGQFAQAVQTNQGDVAKAINNWGKDS